ncbi:MAG: hypothetical protein JOZ47_09290 [Kutzneria sp.]|nr:hypothetical protein [Kutzneria sp.]
MVRSRVAASGESIRRLAAKGNPVFSRLLGQGVADNLARALAELDEFTP